MKIKLSELRQIVKSIIKEQSGTTTPTPPNINADLTKMKNVPVRWYLDEGNTKPFMIMTIKNIIPSGDRIKIEGLWEGAPNTSNSNMTLICANNFVLYRDLSRDELVKLYNTKYIEKLKALLCTKSAGGLEVTNIGDYSSTTSKAPMNVAESKRKLTNVIRQVIKEQNLTKEKHLVMGGATELFEKNGYTIKRSSGSPSEGGVVELSNGENTVILKSSNISNTIQVNGGKVFKYSTVNDQQFKIATMALGL